MDIISTEWRFNLHCIIVTLFHVHLHFCETLTHPLIRVVGNVQPTMATVRNEYFIVISSVFQ